MGTEKLRGIVLREQAKGESNKQIVLLAQGVGRVLLSARGARRAKSKLLAATQLFCYADFVVYEGKGFYSVTQAELKNSFYGLRLDMDKFSEGMYLAELTERSCPAGLEQDAVCTVRDVLEKVVTDYAILPAKPNMDEVKRALTLLENHSIIQRIEGKFNQSGCKFSILPTVLAAVSSEKLNDVVSVLWKEGDTDEETEEDPAD